MSRFYSHVNTAKAILTLYKGEMPFSAFLKNFFSKEKKYGSKDRKNINSLCYNYFRLGHALKDRTLEDKILISVFLCNRQSNEFLQNEKPEWNDKIESSLAYKIALTGLDPDAIFPLNDHLSGDINISAFNNSFLIQPDLFVRIRPGKQEIVTKKLHTSQISFTQVNEKSLAFANGTKLEEVLDVNREVVIQDLNSQRVGDFLAFAEFKKQAKVWDCCAASGGKSIMAFDRLPQIALTVSDVRQSIIQNLQKRFKDAGLVNYQSFVADITKSASVQSALGKNKFDLVICDAPCSGSGTWGRTPEQLLFFKESEIARYSHLQKSIASNTIPFINKGGYLLYITCSVFQKENEEVVNFLQKQFSLKLIKEELLKGYELKADTMFAALFQLE